MIGDMKPLCRTMPLAQLELYENTNATVIDTVNVWQNAQHIAENVELTRFLIVDTDGDGVFIECPPKHDGTYWITLSVSAEGTQNKEYQFGATLNDAIITASVSSVQQAVLGTMLFGATAAVKLEAGDIIRPVVRNITDNANITVKNATFVLVEV